MIEKTLKTRDKVTFDHDPEMFRLIHATAARMHFPFEVKDRRKRDSFQKAISSESAFKGCRREELFKSASKSQKSALFAGEVFLRQCFTAFYRDVPPSLRQMYLSVQKGEFSSWSEKGYPVGSIKTAYASSRPVLHLWAACNYLQAAYTERMPSMAYLYHSPCLFIRIASAFRSIAVKFGIFEKASVLWMPQKWRDAASQVKIVDVVETDDFRETAIRLEKVFLEYTEKRFWEF